jgi:hypothetical protein
MYRKKFGHIMGFGSAQIQVSTGGLGIYPWWIGGARIGKEIFYCSSESTLRTKEGSGIAVAGNAGPPHLPSRELHPHFQPCSPHSL